jgi:SAM-dependent methyltransferase
MYSAQIKNSENAHPGLEFYNLIQGEYDQMMDWESRLLRETPFFEKLISDYKIKSILDVACGTGRHCFHFETLNVETVAGVDPSIKSLEVAKSKAAASGSEVRFIEASFADVSEKLNERFDLVCSLGNSISHLLTYDDLEQAFRNFRQLVSDDGIILVQALNWEARLARQERFFAPRGHSSSKGQKLFFRFFDFHEELVTMNLVIFQSDGIPAQSWSNRIVSTTLRPWRREVLKMALKDTLFEVEHEFGGTNLSVFNSEESPDYIFIARKT